MAHVNHSLASAPPPGPNAVTPEALARVPSATPTCGTPIPPNLPRSYPFIPELLNASSGRPPPLSVSRSSRLPSSTSSETSAESSFTPPAEHPVRLQTLTASESEHMARAQSPYPLTIPAQTSGGSVNNRQTQFLAGTVVGSSFESPPETFESFCDTLPNMPGGAVVMHATTNPDRVEAPVTVRAYFLCVFASFGGIFFGYDTGWMGGVLAMPFFIRLHTGIPIPAADASQAEKDAFTIPAWQQSLFTSILSAGTFFGAIMAGDIADYFGRRITIITGCIVFSVGCILQTASAGGQGLFVAGRLIAGFGVGFISAIIILYLSEIAPRKVRGAIVSGYQFCITIGILLANCVVYASKDRLDSGSYRIPIAVQFLWALILGLGLFLLPESPRWYVKRGRVDAAAKSLSIVRGQPTDSDFVQDELAEIIANHEYESELIPSTTYFSSWAACFSGSVFNPQSNLRRTILGTSLQMMQQWTGINFIFYFGTVFFTSLGTISNPFLISLITTLVNVCSTPLSFWTVEKFGRRAILFWGAIGMVVCEFICAIAGTASQSPSVVKAQIAFICIYIFFFASTWGPAAWVVVGEIFPIPIRSRGVALSTSSNWLWNCIITVITPYLVNTNKADLKSKVFFVWGSTCILCVIYAYLLVWETKGLTLEQVDRMMEECGSPRKSVGWKPHATFASEMGLTADGAHMPVKVGGPHAADEKAHIAAGTKHVQQTEIEGQPQAQAPPAETV